MALVLTTSKELQIVLEPVQVEDRYPSVAFDVRARLVMPFQETTVVVKECWFTHEALNQFEDKLADLRSLEFGKVALLNMSEFPVLEISREGNATVTTIRSTDTMGMSSSTIQVKGYAQDIAVMLEHLRSYEKWW
jgi:hypothetical protein